MLSYEYNHHIVLLHYHQYKLLGRDIYSFPVLPTTCGLDEYPHRNIEVDNSYAQQSPEFHPPSEVLM